MNADGNERKQKMGFGGGREWFDEDQLWSCAQTSSVGNVDAVPHGTRSQWGNGATG